MEKWLLTYLKTETILNDYCMVSRKNDADLKSIPQNKFKC